MIPSVSLGEGYSISRLIKGGWHLAGGHGSVSASDACRDMARFVDAGITAFDCADIYTGVEELIGQFRRDYPSHARRVRIHTKFVADLDRLGSCDAGYVRRIVDRSCGRLGVECIDLVQFHWWDYGVARWVDVAGELDRLRGEGKILHLGATNFNVDALRAIVESGVPIRTHQVQYSVLDTRPENGMAQFCADNDIGLLCYGTVAGGFLSERWLGRPEPAEPLANRSLVKYRLIIQECGSWAALQDVLATLHAVAQKHGVDIATVATRAILDRPAVAAAIVGATNAKHLEAHQAIGELRLDPVDTAAIRSVAAQHMAPGGDVYDLERDREGPHGRIMKYTLNT